MQTEYFSLPLNPGRIIRQQEHPKVSLQQSVMQHLHLLITTAFGEFSGDEAFGCGIWEHDFDNITSAHKLKEIIRQSLLNSIQEKEKRMNNLRVELFMVQEDAAGANGTRAVKKRMNITVTGVLILTNERISFKDSFYVGPLSY